MASFNGKNQFASVSGFVPNYDLDGNLLDDPVAQVRDAYVWYAEGMNGDTQTFDALGRMVENSQWDELLRSAHIWPVICRQLVRASGVWRFRPHGLRPSTRRRRL